MHRNDTHDTQNDTRENDTHKIHDTQNETHDIHENDTQ